MPFEEDFGEFADRGFLGSRERGNADGHIGKTGNFAAIQAEKMGVFVIVVMAGAAEFKPPDVVAMLGPVDEPRFAQIHEVAVDGGLVEAQGGESGSQIGVGEGAGGFLQVLENGDASRGAAQTCFADPIPKFCNRRYFWSIHGILRRGPIDIISPHFQCIRGGMARPVDFNRNCNCN